MISHLERLTKARELMAVGFCKGQLALDKDGFYTTPGGPDAVRHCILGALIGAGDNPRFTHGEIAPLLTKHLPKRWRTMDFPHKADMCTLVGYNNASQTTQQDMLNLLDNAIEGMS